MHPVNSYPKKTNRTVETIFAAKCGGHETLLTQCCGFCQTVSREIMEVVPIAQPSPISFEILKHTA